MASVLTSHEQSQISAAERAVAGYDELLRPCRQPSNSVNEGPLSGNGLELSNSGYVGASCRHQLALLATAALAIETSVGLIQAGA